uniref:ATP synthase subunit b n=1 Tax=Monodon monoceros TaxID=40151 RepID=A0A8C6BSA8_MONMO
MGSRAEAQCYPVVLSAATAAGPSLKSAALLSPGVLQATRIFHTGPPSLASVPPLPEYGEKVHFGLIPEDHTEKDKYCMFSFICGN